MPGFADVTVIVAAYQAADTIERTLASIACQTLKPREVVVVDDGSTDGTFEVAESFRPQMNEITLRVVRCEENKGAGAARNHAIEKSTEKIFYYQKVAFLSDDHSQLQEIEVPNFVVSNSSYLSYYYSSFSLIFSTLLSVYLLRNKNYCNYTNYMVGNAAMEFSPTPELFF